MKTDRIRKIYKTIMLIVLTVAITFIITSVVMYNQYGKNNIKYIATDGMSSTFQMFRNYINQKYIGEIDDKAMLESAIKGYVKGLGDTYSEYITPEEMKEYMEDTTGKYVGIGVYIADDTQNNQIIVLMPIKDSPAEKAGIKSGDIITKIDGIEYKGEQLNQASNALKQGEGTKAKVEVLRNKETLTFEIERKSIKVNHIESKVLDGNIGYIQITTFDEGCYDEFVENWKNLKNNNITSLIIDLRNNGGGIVQESLNIADMMVERDKTLLITTSKQKDEEVTKSKNDKTIDMPIAILINENTASSSEILAAAIKENNEKVTLIGKNTYGKGVIQTIYSLSDGSGLKLTTNEYFTPNRNTINKVGIKPDIEIDFPEDESLYTIEQSKDTQLQKAIEILK
ncbi:MAG: S41 family peptidase [Clostridiaceae bacterium]|nr:S41 family peptidase [Clostridiaceae bacterium]